MYVFQLPQVWLFSFIYLLRSCILILKFWNILNFEISGGLGRNLRSEWWDLRNHNSLTLSAILILHFDFTIRCNSNASVGSILTVFSGSNGMRQVFTLLVLSMLFCWHALYVWIHFIFDPSLIGSIVGSSISLRTNVYFKHR